jgi:anti-sigma regulatory factor (Ser/Thr protein kinase)
VSEDDLLMASRPEVTPPGAGFLPAPPLLADPGTVPAPSAAQPAALPAAQPTATCTLPANAESVKAGRDFTRATLREWGMGAVTDLAELVVSELVTNALRHGIPAARSPGERHCVRLRLLAQAPFVMCMVADPARSIPVLKDADPAAESGRGLTVVEACCVRWGWHLLDEGGKVVWALLR